VKENFWTINKFGETDFTKEGNQIVLRNIKIINEYRDEVA
jgi:hypothetical protein